MSQRLLKLFSFLTILFFPFSVSANTYSTQLNGSNQYFYTTQTALNLTGDFTYEAWVRSEATGGNNVRYNIVGDRSADNSIGKNLIGILGTTDSKGTSHALYAETWASTGGFLTLDSTQSATNGTWFHVAFVKDADNDWKLYVNGVLKDSDTASRTLSNTSKTGLSIGADDYQASGILSYLNGYIDEVRVWNVARTQAEISANYQCELNGNETGLYAYYKFENSAVDSGPNGYSLTAVNSPTYSTTVLPTLTGTCGSTPPPTGSTSTVATVSIISGTFESFWEAYGTSALYILGSGLALAFVYLLRNVFGGILEAIKKAL